MRNISIGYGNNIDLWIAKINQNGKKISAGCERTYRAMVRCAAGKDHTWVNMDTLAKRTNVCRRTIERHIAILKDVGLITSVKKWVNGWLETVYYFLAHPVIVAHQKQIQKKKERKKQEESSVQNTPEDEAVFDAQALKSCPQNVGSTFKLYIETPPLPPSIAEPDSTPEFVETDSISSMESEEQNTVWNEIEKNLIHEDSGKLWMPQLRPDIQSNHLTIMCPNQFVVERVKIKFGNKIKEICKKHDVTMSFDIWNQDIQAQEEKKKQKRAKLQIEQQKHAMAEARKIWERRQTELNELSPKKQFEILWQEYPRKTGKWISWQVFSKFSRSGKLPEFSRLLEMIQMQKQSLDWQRDQGRWVPGLSRWLSEKRWLDDRQTEIRRSQNRIYRTYRNDKNPIRGWENSCIYT